jgi:acylphosphatase
MINLKVVITGKVQGVYFRATAKQEAIKLNVHGYVKNQSDGTLLLELQGTEPTINSMIKWCHKGPILAKVDQVTTKDQAFQNFTSFEIIR